MPKGIWWLVEGAALCAFLCIPGVILSNYAALPAVIPTHFGFSGAPDGFGDKSTMLFVMGVSTLLFAVLSAAPFFPNLINVPGPRTPKNIQAAISMTRALKLEVMVFLAFLSWRMVETAMGRANGLGAVIPLTFIAVLILTIVIGLSRSNRNE